MYQKKWKNDLFYGRSYISNKNLFWEREFIILLHFNPKNIFLSFGIAGTKVIKQSIINAYKLMQLIQKFKSPKFSMIL